MSSKELHQKPGCRRVFTSMNKLTVKQALFVTEYLKTFNATRAAIAAGYSERSAAVIGHENLRKPKIAAKINKFLNDHAMSAAEVLYHLSCIARADIATMVDDDGKPSVKRAIENGSGNLVRKVKTRTMTVGHTDIVEEEIETYDRLRALDLLAKYHDLTNKVRVEDWRSEAVHAIRSGDLEYGAVADELGHELAEELFKSAGVPIADAGEAPTSEV